MNPRSILLLSLAVVCSGIIIGGYVVDRQLSAQDAPAFIVGQRYSVVWDCLPIAPQPCYGEVLEVRIIWRNGWLTVRDMDGDTWIVNPARAIGYQPYRPPAQAGR